MFDIRTPCDTTDDRHVIKLLPNFVQSVLVNSCDGVGSPFLDPFWISVMIYGVLYNFSLMHSHKKKNHGSMSGDLGGQFKSKLSFGSAHALSIS